MDWQNILGVAATVFALASAAGLGLMRGTLGNLRAMNDDLTKRVDFLEKQAGRDEVEKTEMRGQIATLQTSEEHLTSVLRGRADFGALSDQLEDVHRIVIGIDRKLS